MKSKFLAIAVTAVSISTTSYALPDLVDIYQQALDNDATFKQAYSKYMSTREALPQAQAAILPNISFNDNLTYIDYESKASFVGEIKDEYHQRNYTLSLTQPLFNWALWKGVQQASYTVKQALAAYDDAAQDLIIRTATAYFAVLQAKDNVKFSKSQLRANGRSLEQAKQRFKVGLDAITSVYEAQAAYDSSNSVVITSQNNLTNQYEKLRLLTNHTYQGLAPLKSANIPLVKPEPQNIDSWTDKALKQNYNLQSAHYGVLAAKENIGAKNAGHLPTLSLNAGINHTDAKSSVSFLRQDNTITSAKFTLNLPIYQGGLVVSQTRQASFDYQSTREVYENAYRSAIVQTRIAYNTIIDGISTIRADRQAVKSGENSLESTDAQFKVGTRTMVDVVAAQRNLFRVQTQLASDQYSYILAILQLKYQAGTLSVSDLQEINTWLKTSRPYGKPTKPRIHRQVAQVSKPTSSKA